MRLARIAGFRLVTQNPDRLLRFYAALGFAVGAEAAIPSNEMMMLGIAGRGRRWTMTLGATTVGLDCFDAGGLGYPQGADAASRCFQHLALVTDDVDRAWATARTAGAAPISRDGPVTLPDSAGGVTAVKFRDPEGHPLELIRFPDMAARGWTGQGLLGIDHSAIVVSDLAASCDFYELAGLAKGKATLNQGATQATLDGLDAPCADVVPMQPADAPPHVELLHYRRPAAGDREPWAVNDVAATRIVWDGPASALLRDPDGHLHQMVAG